MIRVGDFGPKVPKAVQDEVLARQKDIAAGKLRPFAGPIADNEGKRGDRQGPGHDRRADPGHELSRGRACRGR